MAQLVAQKAGQTGGALALVAASAGGDSFPASSRRVLHVKAGATGTTVTVHSQKQCDQGGTHDVAVVVGANTEKRLGPYPASRFADSNGLIQVTYSQVVTISVACEEV